ncbi:MAG: hypothetical protein HKN23_08140 [Verrucomicrobiales bacterium]|nr:hypothetical protein [Verrucomicrobiales bacterium]
MAITKTATKGIRPLEQKDIGQVSTLFLESFRNKKQSEDCLNQYFREIYLEHPLRDPEIPSLVFENSGIIEGFIGVTLGKMLFRGEPVTAAVSSAFVVKADASGNRNPLTGISLLREFLGGKQDLSVADAANETTRQLWTKSGGAIAYPYSFTWTRPLQPLQAMLELDAVPSTLHRYAKPGAWLGDQVATQIPPIKPRRPDCRVEDIDSAVLLDLWSTLPKQSLVPDYDLNSLQWLIDKACESETEGPLAMRVVRSQKGKALGWYVYFRKRNSIGRVLQIAAFPGSMDVVLDCLIHEAHGEGLAALRGRAEPDHLYVFNKRFCAFQGRPWCLVHSPDPDIVNAFQSADVFFSGFDGELWMKVNA